MNQHTGSPDIRLAPGTPAILHKLAAQTSIPLTSFTDANGTLWSVAISIAAVKRVRELTEVDLGKFFGRGPEAERTREQLSDLVTVANVLFAIVKPQADAKGITDEQFGEALVGDVIGQASEALIEGLLSFQPSREGRAALRQLLAAQKRVAEGRLRAAVRKTMEPDSGDLSTSAPASSESTPAPSPSES